MWQACKVVADSSHLAGHLIDVKSHEGSKIMGQPVFKAHMKEFIPQAEKAAHQIVCDQSEVFDMAKVENPQAKAVKLLKFKDEERAAMDIAFDPNELQEF